MSDNDLLCVLNNNKLILNLLEDAVAALEFDSGGGGAKTSHFFFNI